MITRLGGTSISIFSVLLRFEATLETLTLRCWIKFASLQRIVSVSGALLGQRTKQIGLTQCVTGMDRLRRKAGQRFAWLGHLTAPSKTIAW